MELNKSKLQRLVDKGRMSSPFPSLYKGEVLGLFYESLGLYTKEVGTLFNRGSGYIGFYHVLRQSKQTRSLLKVIKLVYKVFPLSSCRSVNKTVVKYRQVQRDPERSREIGVVIWKWKNQIKKEETFDLENKILLNSDVYVNILDSLDEFQRQVYFPTFVYSVILEELPGITTVNQFLTRVKHKLNQGI